MDETSGRKETHDFMNVNVESFSQLPFIRRAPVKEKAAIRLFGREFGAGDHAGLDDSDSSVTTSYSKNSKNEESTGNRKDNHSSRRSGSNGNNRRFECHYCFRNFPTSQALGGHQNAHKRERQHAKRGAAYFQQGTQVYGFLANHHHRRHYLGGGSASFPSWSSASPVARFYNGYDSAYYTRTANATSPPTINRSPLGLWSVPRDNTAVQGVYATAAYSPGRTSNSTLSLLAGEREAMDDVAGGATARDKYLYGLKVKVQDHMSLDLHL